MEHVTRHAGRWWWAWYRPESGQWYAPTPSLGGGYVGSKDYVCSGAAISYARRSDLLRWLLKREILT